MAESLDDSQFWLPPQFLSDHDKLVAKDHTPVNFPSEFPYEFDTFAPNSSLDSPVESVTSSNETENSDEDFLAALTQRLSQSTLRESQRLTVPALTQNKSEAKVAMAGSPQSTLSGFGSWSGWSTVSSDGSPNGPSQAPSPPTTPFGAENNTWDLIYAAAGQVARLKMSGDGLMGPPRSSNLVSSLKTPRAGLYSHASQFQNGTEDPIFGSECSSTWGREVKVARSAQQSKNQIHHRGRDFCHENGRFGRPLDLPQSAWPSMQAHHRSDPLQPSTPAMPPIFPGGGSAPRKECAGTGVFLPRRYESAPQSCKRADCRPISLFPGKAVHARNTSFEELNRSAASTPLNRRVAPSYDALIARRNSIFAQQRLNYHRATEGAKSLEFLLPQEWTY